MFRLHFLCISLLVLISEGVAGDGAKEYVLESEREVPLAYDVDVIVIGGSSRGVAAAVAASKSGAKVFLAAERPYLGEDICSTYRLWLEEGEIPDSDLAKAIYLTPNNIREEVVNPNTVQSAMNIKKALDAALLKAKVNFLYGSYPSDILVDDQNRLAGVTISNRSGRQAIRGKVIIDASDRAVAARLSKVEFSPYPKGTQEFSWVTIGGNSEGQARKINAWLQVGKRPLAMYEHALQLEMGDGSWQSFSKADQKARDLTWSYDNVTSSERLHQVPPDTIRSRVRGRHQGMTLKNLDLNALRPDSGKLVYVLGGCADVPRAVAKEILRPLSGMKLGEQVGKMAAKEALKMKIGEIHKIKVFGKLEKNSIALDVGELLQGIRSMAPLSGQKTIKSPARSIPVLGRYDTVVVGGGTGGAPAGIGAARGGAKTLVVEYLYGLGGVGTIGRISSYYHGNKVGFTEEVERGMKSFQSDGQRRKGWNIEHKMEWLRSEVTKAGGDIWFRSLAVGSLMDGKRCVGVVVATPFGRGAVLANTVIDSTGNAVIPACAGLETQVITGEHISVQGTGLPQQDPGQSKYNSDWTFVDDDDVLDMWRIMVVGRTMIGRSKYSRAFDLGQLIDTRARRRIVGDLVIAPMDIENNRTYPDTITISKSDFDNHGFSSHDLFMVTAPNKKGLVGHVPYRALLPKGVDGLLVTGLGMSAHGDAMPVMRMQADVQNHGYAAGKASAMAAENGTTVRKINVDELQEHLVGIGVIPESVLGDTDTYPFSKEVLADAVRQIGVNYQGISKVMTDVDSSLPLLREAYSKSKEDDAKLRYAHVLGMLYDNTGVQTLIDVLEKSEWDKGWNFRGLGQYGATTSYIDNLVIALGRTKSEAGLPVLLAKLRALDSNSEFSHCRAVAIALEIHRSSVATEPLMRLLKQSNMIGHSFLDIQDVILRTAGHRADTSTRNASLKELILARALYRCGDYEGLGRKILLDYTKDYRGHYSRHAKHILRENL